MTRRPQKKANQGGMTGAWLGGKMWQNGLIKKIKLKKECKGKLGRHYVGMAKLPVKKDFKAEKEINFPTLLFMCHGILE